MKSKVSYLNIIIPCLFLLILFYLPISLVLIKSLTLGKEISLQAIIDVIKNPLHQGVILFTIKQAFYSAIATIILSLPLAWIFGKYNFIGKQLLKSFFLVPFILPGITVALGFILFYGNSGFLNQFLNNFGFKLRILYSFKAIIMAHIFYNIPIAIRIISNTIEKFNIKLIHAAKSLGANDLQVFFKIYLPCLIPSIINAFILIFIYCFMTFGIVLILGDVAFTTIEVDIFILIRQQLNYKTGMALGFVQIIISLLFLTISRYFQIKSEYFQSFILEEKNNPPSFNFMSSTQNKLKKILESSYFIIALIFILAPIISVFFFFINNLFNYQSFVQHFNLFTYDPIIGTNKLSAITNSLIIGLCSSFITVILALLLSFGIYNKKYKYLELFAVLPMGISSVTFGLGFLLLLNYINISRYLLLIFAHSVICFPLVFKIIYEGVIQLKRNYLSAAKILGANSIQVFTKITLPLMRNNLFNALMLSFAISLGEFGAASILQRNFVTIPIAIYRHISARDFISATGMSLILILTAIIVFYASEHLKSILQKKA
jgi:thiamine transport system permease protein